MSRGLALLESAEEPAVKAGSILIQKIIQTITIVLINLEQFICNIYETRPYGCRVYPSTDALIKEKHAGCGYYLEELN